MNKLIIFKKFKIIQCAYFNLETFKCIALSLINKLFAQFNIS